MKLRDLIELTRGLDDKGFLERFPCPFLLEEGLLHETRHRIDAAKERNKTPVELAAELTKIGERQVFPIRRRDGKHGDVAIGRGELMDIRLDLQSVSTRHAMLKSPGDGRARWCVVDTVSTNGTFVDGVRIATGREVELNEATVVRFGPELRLAYYDPRQLLHVVRQLGESMKQTEERIRASQREEIRKEAEATHELPLAQSRLRIAENADASQLETDVFPIIGRGEKPGSERPRPPSDRLPKQGEPLAPGTTTEKRPKADPLKAPLPGAQPISPTAVPPTHRIGRPAPERPPPVVTASTTVVLACEPFAPVTLEPGKPIFLGRVPGNDFVLPNPQVSRRHCEVERVQDGVLVRDLRSANGTFVNEARIERSVVPFGRSFRIGPYRLEVRAVDPVAQMSEPMLGDSDTMMAVVSPDGLRGTFEDMPLHEILQGVEFNQKTGVIDIQGESGVAGFVSFRLGSPHQARCGSLEGEAAVLGLLALGKGRFVLRGDEAAVGPREIAASFTKVLLEHRRKSDEGKKR